MEGNLFYSKSKSRNLLEIPSPPQPNTATFPTDSISPNKGQEILIMTIDIGDGQKEPIIVHEADEPSDLAHSFAIKFGINKKLEEALTHQIEFQIELLIKEQEQKMREEAKKMKNIPEIDEAASYELLEGNSRKEKFLQRSASENIGEKLYFKGIQQKERTERNNQMMKLKIQEKQSNELTFKPAINNSRNETIKKSTSRHEESLISQKTIKEEKLEKERAEKIEKEKEICTFTPQVNPMSEKILQRKMRQQSKDKFNELYEEAKIRKIRQEEINKQVIANEFSYRPEINENNPRFVGDQDPVERYYEIFKMLNPDYNDEISWGGIIMENIDSEVFAIIRPLLEELEGLDQNLNFEEFCESMDNLVKILSPAEKRILTCKKPKGVPQTERSDRNNQIMRQERQNNDDYRPKTNRAEPKKASGRREDSLIYQKVVMEEKLEKLKDELLEKEKEICTFVPQINHMSEKILQRKQRQTKDRFSELYENAKIRKIKQEEKNKQIIANEFPYKPEVYESNSRFICKNRVERYYDIYKMLNPDHNGEISWNGIIIERIETEVFTLIRPLLEELEGLGQNLNFEEFCESMDNLVKILSPVEKRILTTKKRQKKEEEPELKLQSINRSQLPADLAEIYDRQMDQRIKADKRLELEREKLKASELDGCTFQPKIKVYRPQQEYYDRRYKINSN